MDQDWIPFSEAIFRMSRGLHMLDFDARPMLRDLVQTGRVTGRGQRREKGNIVLAAGLDSAELDADPNLIREGRSYYTSEIFPVEVRLSELQEWMATFARPSVHQDHLNPFLARMREMLAQSSTDASVSLGALQTNSDCSNGGLEPEVPNQRASGKWPAVVADMRRKLFAAKGFMSDNGYSALTRQEAENILADLFEGSRGTHREVVADKNLCIPAATRRRAPGILGNRNKELGDCRQFLRTAS